MKKFITIAVILAVIVGGAWFGFKRWTAQAIIAQSGPVSVRTELATIGDLTETINAPGNVQPRTKVSISAKVSARIVELPHKEGQVVTKGDPKANPPIPASVLVRLDSKDLEANLRSVKARYAAQKASASMGDTRIASMEASLKSAHISLADMERDLNRQKGLLSTKDVSQSIVDTAQSKYDSQKAQIESQLQSLAGERLNIEVLKHNLEAADAEISKSEEDLSNTVISSPIDGLVIKLNNQVGEMVVVGITNSAGTTIMEVADMDHMLFIGKIDETTVASVKAGQKAIVRIPAYPKDDFDGVIETVGLSNTDDKDGTKYFKAEIRLETGGKRILSGLTADAEIETRRHEKVIIVPRQALVGRPVESLPDKLRELPQVNRAKPTATVVFRLINGKAVVTPVEVGASNATHTVIKSGLTETDRIITGPYKVLDTIAHDTVVKESNPATKPVSATTKPANASTKPRE